MSPYQASRLNGHAFASLILILGLLATWFAYAPGLGGSLHFDDLANLGGLTTINDKESVVRFVASGHGPLGRPLALASFVPEAYAWPDMTAVFLRTNILIHLLNGALVTWFLYLLGSAQNQTSERAAVIAVGATTIWLLMPLLASSTLFIVQRMTTLSATFVLTGAVAYLYARRRIALCPRAALLGMTLAIATGATIAALAKENGALLFLFILAIEATLLSRPLGISRPLWRTWFAIMLVAPLVVLVFYLASILPYAESAILRRGFNGFERFITQAEILWKYLYLAFLPNVPSLGPFHDDYPVRQQLFNFATLLSLISWGAVVVVAILLRKKAPLLTFAVTWYLLGHLLESTTLDLELYFEHRNYMPLMGPVYALVAAISHLNPPWRHLASGAAAIYITLLASILFSITSLWGSPTIAAEMWQIYKPQSKRANVHLTQSYERRGDFLTARRILETYTDRKPNALGAQLYVLGLSCKLGDTSESSQTIASLGKELSSTDFSFFISNAFAMLATLVEAKSCPDITEDQVYLLGASILKNPKFKIPIIQHNVHIIMSKVALERRNFQATLSHIEAALDALYEPETLFLAVAVLNSGGQHDISRQLLQNALTQEPPIHPLRRYRWRQDIDQIKTEIAAIDRLSGHTSE